MEKKGGDCMKVHLSIDKSTFVFIVAVYNAVISYVVIPTATAHPLAAGFAITVGNAGIVLLAAESGNEAPAPTPVPSPAST
jgi:hypothetical protein